MATSPLCPSLLRNDLNDDLQRTIKKWSQYYERDNFVLTIQVPRVTNIHFFPNNFNTLPREKVTRTNKMIIKGKMFWSFIKFSQIFLKEMYGDHLMGEQGWGSKGGAVVRALASHQCGSGSNPGVEAICGLSLLLVLYLAPRGFSPGTPVFPYP